MLFQNSRVGNNIEGGKLVAAEGFEPPSRGYIIRLCINQWYSSSVGNNTRKAIMFNRTPRNHCTEYIIVNTRLCKACWECIEACPEGVLGKIEILFHKHVRIDHAEKCVGCLNCVQTCPQGAITSYAVNV